MALPMLQRPGVDAKHFAEEMSYPRFNSMSQSVIHRALNASILNGRVLSMEA